MARKRGNPRSNTKRGRGRPRATAATTMEINRRVSTPENKNSPLMENQTGNPSPKTPEQEKHLMAGSPEDEDIVEKTEAYKRETGINNEKREKLSYADVVGGTSKVQYDLSYIQTEEINGQKLAKFTKDDVLEDMGSWDKAIICCVLGQTHL
ncbi:unnamed protein product [Cuscuta campestris]|uniref:Uncharacterized protein n=1 Tax=Cuscuta campestris TaxID=132261 RepID=A0A484MIW6_9ASTE|nr:unnamed protein product [Cuscuta campestris]